MNKPTPPPQLLLLLAVIVALAGACGGQGSQRCQGQTIERRTGGALGHGPWKTGETCGAGTTCKEFQVVSHNYPQHAFCVAAAGPHSACRGMTGRFCAGNGRVIACIQGFELGGRYGGLACSTAQPHCYEPEPGMAFCVADPNPAPVCSGRATRSIDFCAVDYSGCREAQFAQFCADARTSITCLHGVPIKTNTCGGNGRCVETSSVEVHPCDYIAPSSSSGHAG